MADDKKKVDVKKAISLSPEIASYFDEWTRNPQSKVFVKLAEEYRKSGLIEEALDVCEKGLTANPKYLGGNMMLAKIYFDMGEYDKSFQEVKKVSSVQQDNLMAQNLILELYIKKGDKDNAIRVCDIISYLDPKNESVANKKKELKERGIVNVTPEPVRVDDEPGEVETAMKREFVATTESAPYQTEKDDKFGKNVEFKKKDDFTTNTVAELYIKQGYFEKGLNIYKELLAESPDEIKLIKKINEIEKMIEAKKTEEPKKEIREASDEVLNAYKTQSPVKIISKKDNSAEDTPKVRRETPEPKKSNQIIKLEDWLGKVQSRGRR